MITCRSLLLLCLGALLPVSASMAEEAQKDLTFGRAAAPQIAPSSTSEATTPGALDVSLTALKQSYKVDEPIRLKVRGNQRFYLYLFNIDRKSDQAVLLFPGAEHKGNRYNGGASYTVPNKDFEFAANEAGEETLVMVASTRYLDWNSQGYAQAGRYLVASAKSADEQFQKLLSLRSVNSDAATSSTQQAPAKPAPATAAPQSGAAGNNKVVVKTLKLSIGAGSSESGAVPEGVAYGETSASADAMVFVTTDKPSYRENEPVSIIYGADKKGYVSIFTQTGADSIALLKTFAVDGKSFGTLRAMARKPFGEQQLVAVYSAKPVANSKQLVADVLQTQSAAVQKGLRIGAPAEASGGASSRHTIRVNK